MIFVLHPVPLAGNFQLAFQGLCIYPYAHGGKLQRLSQRIVPEKKVPVKRPIVVIGRASVVSVSAPQRAADSHQKYGAVFLRRGAFPLLRRQIGIGVLQLLRGDEINVSLQRPRKGGIHALDTIMRIDDRIDDPLYNHFEKVKVSFF